MMSSMSMRRVQQAIPEEYANIHEDLREPWNWLEENNYSRTFHYSLRPLFPCLFYRICPSSTLCGNFFCSCNWKERVKCDSVKVEGDFINAATSLVIYSFSNTWLWRADCVLLQSTSCWHVPDRLRASPWSDLVLCSRTAVIRVIRFWYQSSLIHGFLLLLFFLIRLLQPHVFCNSFNSLEFFWILFHPGWYLWCSKDSSIVPSTGLKVEPSMLHEELFFCLGISASHLLSWAGRCAARRCLSVGRGCLLMLFSWSLRLFLWN